MIFIRRCFHSDIITSSGLAAVLFLFQTGCSRSGPVAQDKRHQEAVIVPNIVLVVVDALRADHLSQYGYGLDTSPALNELSRHATLFKSAYSPSSWTVPSVASLFSGLSPPRHKIINSGDALSSDLITLAELLQENDYETAGFSYNHHIAKKTSFDQGFKSFIDHERSILSYPDISKMMKEIENWRNGYRGSKPFFLYLQPMNCHGPYRVPACHEKDLLGRSPNRKFRYYDEIMSEIMWKGRIEKRDEVTDEYLKSLEEQYDTAIRYSTDRVGELLTKLKQWDLYDDSMIIVTADHGEELFDHGGFSHGYSLYEEVVHVPLLIKMPFQKRSQTINDPVTLMDIYPTVLEALDIDLDHFVDGQSVLSLLKKGQYLTQRFENEDAACSYKEKPLFFHLDWPERGKIRAIRWKENKLIEIEQDFSGQKNTHFLFNLKNDPAEKINIIENNAKLSNTLSSQLKAQWKIFSTGALGSPRNVLSEMDKEVLKALGYMQ
jgi:choline-sulfatase